MEKSDQKPSKGSLSDCHKLTCYAPTSLFENWPRVKRIELIQRVPTACMCPHFPLPGDMHFCNHGLTFNNLSTLALLDE